ncbi:MAG: TadE family protein [Phycisphaerae bacterium]
MRRLMNWGKGVKPTDLNPWASCPWRARGTAIVEFAVVLPLLLALLFGIVEFGWLFMIRQSLGNAAREGCRVAVLQTATEEMRSGRIDEVMEPLGLDPDIWSFTASELGDTVQWVRVSVPVADVALTGALIVSHNYMLAGESSMRKEGM